MVIGVDASRAFGSFIGGPENYSYYLIRELLKLGQSSNFRLYLKPSSLKSPRFKDFFNGLPNSNYEITIISWPFLWTQGGLAIECLSKPPDLLFVPAHTLPILRHPKLKTLVTIHDLGSQFLPNYHEFPQKHYLNFATEYSVRRATKIIAVSNYTKKDIIEKLRARSDKIEVVYEGFDRSLFYPRTEAEISRTKEKYGIYGSYFLFVGTVQPRKNLVRLIEAFSRLENRNCQLVIAGSPGWLYEEIYASPKMFGVAERVQFIGRVGNEDLPSLLSGSIAFVFPSLFEGFGLSLLEAMASGTPVLASSETSLPEVGGPEAFYVNPYNVDEIAESLSELQSLPFSERERRIRAGLRHAERFSWEKAARETLSVIDDLLSNKRIN